MKYFKLKTPNIDNEQGFVLAGAMMVLIVLVLIGLRTMDTTTIESQISSYDRTEKTQFYNQETCLGTAKMVSANWLTTAFITSTDATAAFPPAATGGNDLDGDGIVDTSEVNDANNITVASYEVRHITTVPYIGGNLSTFADDVPSMSHIDKPPPGAGYSQDNFEIRQYSVTCQPPDVRQRVVLQEGVFKVFNKFSI